MRRYDGFDYDVTDGLKPAGNELLVYVFDPSDTGKQPNGKQRVSAISNPGGDTYVISKETVMFCGRAFFLILLGGQAPHVLRAHVGHTRGEPNGTELTAAQGLLYYTAHL